MLKWGQPINPAVLLGAPDDDFDLFPSAADFGRAMAALFRTAVQPDLKTTLAAYNKRLAHMVENDHSASTLNSITLELIWPQPTAPPGTQGWL